ncbi:33554_t:CDS:2 [Gigaspora margarita]|uniref:33554_t:CDS:1 n=1 Tax=Gigaspora margarita TaxID=4874 RepID=A0ABN7UEG6_GIGMA|nr:33554_t:CDS:2 [Gigaspora margarita]
MSTKFLVDIIEDYKQFYETKKDYDTAYIRGALASNLIKITVFIFKKPNISPSIFEFIFKCLYCGDVDIQNQDGETVLEFLITLDEFGLTSLIDYVQQYFIENQKNF